MQPTPSIFAERALLPDGWANDVRLTISGAGVIDTVQVDQVPAVEDLTLTGKILLPAPANLHSHAFQRAMAGLTEFRSQTADDFWSWRSLMYRFVDRLNPAEVQAIAAQVQMEMLEAGYASCAEFHYLHHQPDGRPYDNVAEMSARLAAAADMTGIGLTMLPVYYRDGGLNGRPTQAQQRRFVSDRSTYESILAGAREMMADLPGKGQIGVAPHSLRAVSPGELAWVADALPDRPIHIHIAEQTAEVEEVQAALGARPVRWLLDNLPVDSRWCLVHATHLEPRETTDLAATGAVAGLCPITESNLGDGIFDGARYIQADGRLGVGSDSNIRISLSEELRTLEYSQRLRDRSRAVLAKGGRSVGRTLFELVLEGGRRAAGRACGEIAVGALADLMTLDGKNADLAGLNGDYCLDAFVFAADDRLIEDTFAAGRHVVQQGRHTHRQIIESDFNSVVCNLRSSL